MTTILTIFSWVLLFLFFKYIKPLEVLFSGITVSDAPAGPPKYGDLNELVLLLFLILPIIIIASTYLTVTSQHSKQLVIFLVLLNLVMGFGTGYLYVKDAKDQQLLNDFNQAAAEKEFELIESLSKNYKLTSGNTILTFLPDKNLVFQVNYDTCYGDGKSEMCNLVILPFGKLSENEIELYSESWNKPSLKDVLETFISPNGTSLIADYSVVYKGVQNDEDYYLEEFQGHYISYYPYNHQAPVNE